MPLGSYDSRSVSWFYGSREVPHGLVSPSNCQKKRGTDLNNRQQWHLTWHEFCEMFMVFISVYSLLAGVRSCVVCAIKTEGDKLCDVSVI